MSQARRVDVSVQKRVHGHEVIGVKGGTPILRQFDGGTDEVLANHVQQERQARCTRSNVGTGSRQVPQRATSQPAIVGQEKLVGSDTPVAIQCRTHDDDIPAVGNVGQEAFESVVVLKSGSLDKVGNHGGVKVRPALRVWDLRGAILERGEGVEVFSVVVRRFTCLVNGRGSWWWLRRCVIGRRGSEHVDSEVLLAARTRSVSDSAGLPSVLRMLHVLEIHDAKII
jgi:hypothetical protein